jgi:hypothetical protein
MPKHQEELISGQNIKTINGNPILGSGDLEINSQTPVVGNATRVLYMSDNQSGISNYKLLTVDYSSLGALVVQNLDLTSNNTPFLINSWTLNNFGAGNRLIPGGVWELSFRANITNVNQRDTTVYGEVYKRDNVGAETLLFTTTNSGVISDLPVFYNITIPQNDITLSANEVLVFKFYAISSGGGSQPTIQFRYSDNSASRVTIPADSVILISDVINLTSQLDSKEPVISPKLTAFNKDFGTTAGTVCEGNDPRLNDARTPLTHAHTIGDVTGLTGALDAKIGNAVDTPNTMTGIWTGTQAQYTALGSWSSSVIYNII